MAQTRVGGLNVLLSASTGKFTQQMNAAGKQVSKTSNGMIDAGKNVAKYGAAFAAVAAGGLALLVKGSLKSIDTTAKLSTQLRISTESLSAYNLAADITGTSIEDVSGSLLKMTKNLGDADAGVGTAKQGLQQLGLSMSDLKGLKTEQQFELIADNLNKIDDPLKRASAGSAIFGRSFQKIDNFIALGSDGFKKFREETIGFGTSLSRIDASKVELANDAMRRIKEVFNGVIQQLTIRLAPIITVVSRSISGMATNAGGFGNVIDSVISFAIKGVGLLVDGWDGLQIVWGMGKIALAEIGIIGNTAIDGLVKGFNFMAQLGTAVWDSISNGIGSVGAVFKLVFTGIENGIRSFVKFVGSSLATVLNQASEATRNVKGMSDVADGLQMAAAKIAASTGALTVKNKENIEAAKTEMLSYSAAAIDAQGKLGALITGNGPAVEGSEDAVARAATLEQLKQTAIGDVITLAEQERSSVTLTNTIAAAVAEANAEAAVIAEAENAKTELITTAAGERQAALSEQQQAHLNQFGKAEASAVQKNQELWASGMRGRAKVVGGVLNSLGSLMNSKNRKAFEIGKAASIGSTTIATVEASMQAYKSLAGIPIVGPALGIAAAAAAAASGAMAISQIKSTSFGGGGSPSFSGGTVGAVGASSAPAGGSGDLAGIATPKTTAITINAEDEGAMLSGQALVALINRAQADGALIESIRIGTTNV